MRRQFSSVTVLILTAIVGSAGMAGAQPRYDVIDLGSLAGNFSEALHINEKGHIVGTSRNSPGGPEEVVVWKDGEMHALGVTATQLSHLNINNNGWISGWKYYDDIAFVLSPDPVQPNKWVQEAQWDGGTGGINDFGQVAGWRGNFDEAFDEAVIWSPGVGLTEPLPSGYGPTSTAWGDQQ